MTILGIESSCDETAVAVVRRNPDGQYRVLSNEVWSQTEAHAPYGGVVPEIAARSHVERIDGLMVAALENASTEPGEIDAVAATAGPGLVGGVMVGLTAAKGFALAHDLPLLPVNHLEGHALSVHLTQQTNYPYLLLLVSGGHTQLIAVEGLGQYHRMGTTIDDAAGEAFDKTAKLLGLGQPGGPMIERAATGGRADRFALPKPLAKRDGADFSFSGLKTAVRLAVEGLSSPTGQDVADIAASFQAAAARHLADRTARAMELFDQKYRKSTQLGHDRDWPLVVAGGVAANCTIKAALSDICSVRGWVLSAPPVKFCTDNGAMIGVAGAERFAAGLIPERDEALAFAPRARWPLAPPPMGAEHGGGKKGPKA
ncbi:MAG: tRNA (adenosine(37)-N6)-threonylcarbamoyltransferase complex transferase subunit TsaD [Pseudomonadota bacterium]